MVEKEERTSKRELVRVAFSTSVVHFLMASAIGYTGASIGVFQTNTSIIQFTMLFSTFWGMFGMAMVWKRERENIEIPYLEGFAQSYLNIGKETKILTRLESFFSYVYFPEFRVDHKKMLEVH